MFLGHMIFFQTSNLAIFVFNFLGSNLYVGMWVLQNLYLALLAPTKRGNLAQLRKGSPRALEAISGLSEAGGCAIAMVCWAWLPDRSRVPTSQMRRQVPAALSQEILGSRGKRPGVLMNSWTQPILFTIPVEGSQAATPRTRSQVFPDFQ